MDNLKSLWNSRWFCFSNPCTAHWADCIQRKFSLSVSGICSYKIMQLQHSEVQYKHSTGLVTLMSTFMWITDSLVCSGLLVRNLLWCWLSMVSRFLQGTSTACRWISAPPSAGDNQHPRSFLQGLQEIFTPMPAALLPSTSPQLFVSVGLFCSYSYSSLPAALFHSFLNRELQRYCHYHCLTQLWQVMGPS